MGVKAKLDTWDFRQQRSLWNQRSAKEEGMKEDDMSRKMSCRARK